MNQFLLPYLMAEVSLFSLQKKNHKKKYPPCLIYAKLMYLICKYRTKWRVLVTGPTPLFYKIKWLYQWGLEYGDYILCSWVKPDLKRGDPSITLFYIQWWGFSSEDGECGISLLMPLLSSLLKSRVNQGRWCLLCCK